MAQAAAVIKSFHRGIMYRGREGHWAWMMHRVAGLGVLLFLLLHICEIFLIGFGSELIGKFLVIYHSPPFRVVTVFLIYGVLYHGMNGLRITILDFWPETTRHERKMFWGVIAIVLPVTLIAAYATIAPIFTGQ